MNILITSAGRRVSLVRSFQKELKKVFNNGKVYATDAEPELSAACQVADDSFIIPRLDESNYMEALIDLCKTHKIKLIIPTIDTELLQLAKNKLRLEQHGIQVLISSIEFISKCRDKRTIHNFLKSIILM